MKINIIRLNFLALSIIYLIFSIFNTALASHYHEKIITHERLFTTSKLIIFKRVKLKPKPIKEIAKKSVKNASLSNHYLMAALRTFEWNNNF